MSYHRLAGLLVPLVLLVPSAAAQVAATALVNTSVLTVQVAGLPPTISSIVPGTAVPSPPLSGSILAQPNLVFAGSRNALASTASEVALTLTESINCFGTTSGSLRSELLLQVTAAQAVPVAVEIVWTIGSAAGAPLPVVEVDIDNDGSVDLRGQPNSTVRLTLQLTGTRQFLLRSAASAASTVGSSEQVGQEVELRIVPDRREVVVFPILAPCSTTTLDVDPTFSRGVAISGNLAQVTPPLGLPFLVIGFSTLFAPIPTTPLCFLLPNTDIVVRFPTTPLLLDARVVGPQQFFVQGVWLGFPPVPTTTTNGVFVRF